MNEQCRHPYTCACESCEPSPRQLCECEHEAHAERCDSRHSREVKTAHGTFRLCVTCDERRHMRPECEPVSTPLPEGLEGF